MTLRPVVSPLPALCLFTASVLGCQSLPGSARVAPPPESAARDAASPAVVDLKALPQLQSILPRLAEKRVVFVGETHDRFADHLNQLAVIQGLYAVHPDLVIAMEYFQQPFQPYLDAYVAGALSEKEMLRKTEYFERWGFDYRLYRPILRYARDHAIPLLALNVPQELRRKVAHSGFAGLTSQERAQVPADIDRSDAGYRERLEGVFRQHPNAEGRSFERFLDVQLLWDEGMAERAARYLREHPGGHMVVLAGSGHLAYGSGIPKRLTRRIPADTAIVLNEVPPQLDPEAADYLLLAREAPLGPSGTLGVMLESTSGRAAVKGFTESSPAKTAGLKPGDRVVAIDDHPVETLGDLKIAMLDRAPGDRVRVRVTRAARATDHAEMEFHVTLQ